MDSNRPDISPGALVAVVLALCVGLSVLALVIGLMVRGGPVSAQASSIVAGALGALIGAVVSWLGGQHSREGDRHDRT
jgi:hypothetical protein